MDKDLIKSRMVRILTEVRTDWSRDVAKLAEEFIAANRQGSGRLAVRSMEYFGERLTQRVDQALAELADNIPGRGRTWHWAHDFLADEVRSRFADMPEANYEVTWTTKELVPGCLTVFNLAMANAEAAVRLHQADWSAPKREPWQKRHSLVLAIAGAMLAYIAGLYTDDARAALDRAFGSATHQPHPGGASSSPGGDQSP